MRARSERKRARTFVYLERAGSLCQRTTTAQADQERMQEKERATGLSEPVMGLADQRSDGRAKDSLERFY
jgi:hypothetical protein